MARIAARRWPLAGLLDVSPLLNLPAFFGQLDEAPPERFATDPVADRVPMGVSQVIRALATGLHVRAEARQEIEHLDAASRAVLDDRALGRFPNHGEEWILFDGLNLYHGNQIPGSTGCLPTPGMFNHCDAAPTEETSWSSVKRAYPEDP